MNKDIRKIRLLPVVNHATGKVKINLIEDLQGINTPKTVVNKEVQVKISNPKKLLHFHVADT